MSPFSKLIGVFAALATIIGAADHTALVSLFGATGAGVALSVCALVTLLSHSLTGNGAAVPGAAPSGPQT